MFGTLGGPEILFILVLALIIFGPRKLPEIGKSMGKMLAEFRKASTEFKRTIEDEVEAEKTTQALPEPATPVPVEVVQAAPAEPTVARETAPAPPAEPAAPAEPAETKQA